MRGDLNAYLSLYGTLISVVRPTIVAAILLGLWVALQRTGLEAGRRSRTWIAIAVPLVVWLAVVWVVAEEGAFEPRPGGLPLVPMAIVIPPIIWLFLLMRSRTVALA